MAGIFDVHAHLAHEKYVEEGVTVEEIVDDARNFGVDRIVNVGYNVETSKIVMLQANRINGLYAAVGIHPLEVKFVTDEAYAKIDDYANSKKVLAIGEIGLDYYEKNFNKENQLHGFEMQLKIAKQNNLAVLLHIRDVENNYTAFDDVLKLLDKYDIKRAAVHSFTGNWDIAQKFIKRGYYISISGLITYARKFEELKNVVKNASLNYLVIESDSPHITPEPKKGKLNYPGNLQLTINKITSIKGIEKDEVISSTRVNAQKLFGLLNKKDFL
ncbi:TatD family hydrolase [Spiroplasma endosymbiont of Labia minor]|uniref:TatD family hydrolase n=1 Tax=Spiroplasma endosymbiont of Labia minor TaxID=3066305 RepID=UPI0030D175E1